LLIQHFVNSALKIQCHVVKNTHLQTAFSVILPTGFTTIRLKWGTMEWVFYKRNFK